MTSSSSNHGNNNHWKKYIVTPQIQKSIEQIIFQHKLILLPNKTLLDTVQPVEQWTLKQPTKNGGCACCDEEPEDDDNDDADGKRKTNIGNDNPLLRSGEEMTTSPTTNMKTTRTSFGYVDGKTKFAFDPSQFA